MIRIISCSCCRSSPCLITTGGSATRVVEPLFGSREREPQQGWKFLFTLSELLRDLEIFLRFFIFEILTTEFLQGSGKPSIVFRKQTGGAPVKRTKESSHAPLAKRQKTSQSSKQVVDPPKESGPSNVSVSSERRSKAGRDIQTPIKAIPESVIPASGDQTAIIVADPLNIDPPSVDPLNQEFDYGFTRQVPKRRMEDLTKPDKDPFIGLNDFVKRRLSERTKEQMIADGGKYMRNMVQTLRFSSDSRSSCPSDPKTTVFPVPIIDESAEEDYLDEEGRISGTRKFSTDEKKKAIKTMVKSAYDKFKDSLKGLEEAYVGPIMGHMAEVIVTCLFHFVFFLF
ncbi:T-complex protein 1 subunit zeta 2 [Bienertia sinuspersici]